MKKTIREIIRWFLAGCIVWNAGTVQAQLALYPEIYPELPFNMKKATELGNNKCSIWKGTYQKGEADRAGEIWTTPIQDAHPYQRYEFVNGKMTLLSTYLPSGFKQSSMEFFYKDNLISAVEILKYDSLQNTSLDFTYVYIYEHDGTPFQRVKMFGYPNKSVRLLDQFEFDSLNHVVRQKTTAVGHSPHMDSLVGLLDKEKLLTITEYTDSTFSRRVYKNLYEITQDKKTFLDEQERAVISQVRNSSGKILFTIDYKYSNNQLVKKIHWVMRELRTTSVVPEKEDIPVKKKRKKKMKKQVVEQPALLPSLPPRPEVYKIEYFTYNSDGLLEMHMTEEEGVQTILEYTYFSE